MWFWLFSGILVTGLVLLVDGIAQVCVSRKTGPWKDGGASSLAGAILVGVSVLMVWLNETWLGFSLFFKGNEWCFSIAGLVLAFTGVVQICVRKKTGPWKEGGASLLAGAIITGLPVFVAWLTGMWLAGNIDNEIWWNSTVAGLVLLFNGVVQLCVRKKKGQWKDGGASSLAGAIIVGVSVFVVWLNVGWGSPHGFSFMGIGSIIAGLVLAITGVVRLCVREKTGPWKEGGASSFAGGIIVAVWVLVLLLLWIGAPH